MLSDLLLTYVSLRLLFPMRYMHHLGAKHGWTEAALVARLARHGPEHHWQCNWRVALASSSMCAGKWWTLEQLLWQYQYPFSYITRKCLFLVEKILKMYFVICNKLELLSSRHSAATRLRFGGKYYMGFSENLTAFQAVKNFDNRLRFDEVIATSWWSTFLDTMYQGVPMRHG